MSKAFDGDKGGKRRAEQARRDAQRREQQANEVEARARQKAERGSADTQAGGGRGRNMLVGRLNQILPKNLGGVS